jgi:hypothetical protein
VQRQRRELVAADSAYNLQVEPREAFELSVEIAAEIVVAVELFDQLEDSASAERMDLLDMPLTA